MIPVFLYSYLLNAFISNLSFGRFEMIPQHRNRFYSQEVADVKITQVG